MPVLKRSSDNIEIISNYLKKHPEFFEDNRELLNHLKIPHGYKGNVSSLLELQVKQLQENNHKLTETLKQYKERHINFINLSEAAIEHQNLLLQQQTVEDLYNAFYSFLAQHYQVHYLLFFLFVDKRPYDDYKGLKFKKNNSKLQMVFTSLFHRNKPLCDSLQSDYLEGLFGKRASTIRSTAAFPVQSRTQGLMVIASRKTNCYQHGLAINQLDQLKTVFAHQLFNIIWK